MKKSELLTILQNQRASSIQSDDSLNALNQKLYDSYNQEPYGTEEEGRSQVVAADHMETVESDMPTFVRVFLGPHKILHFKSLKDEDKEEAIQKTEFADYIVRRSPESFKVIFDALKEPGISKYSVVKTYCEDKTSVSYVNYSNVTDEELAVFLSDLDTDKKIKNYKIMEKTVVDEFHNNISVKVERQQRKIKIIGVPPENFGISKNATSTQDATVSFDDCYKLKGELIAEGYSKELVRDLPIFDKTKEEQKRLELLRQSGNTNNQGHWTTDLVKITYYYSLVDYDDDGIPERRMIAVCGTEILENTPYDRCPYSLFTQIPMPHVLIGKSRGEYAAAVQKQKTAIERILMDNGYAHGRPRLAVNDSKGNINGGKVNFDDALDHKIGGLVRTDGDPNVLLKYLEEPYVGNEMLQVIQYIDSKKVSAQGNSLSNQGLDADKFYRETATRFEGVEKSSAAKIELVLRVYAEIGFRDLYDTIIWTAQHFQNDEIEIPVLGKPMLVDPRKWKYEHTCISSVGEGAGDTEEAIANLSALLNTQLQLSRDPRFAHLVDANKIYNTLDDLARALGKPDTNKYYNNPEIPLQQLMAALEQAKLQIQQLQQLAAQNPLEAPEKIRAESDLLAEQNKRDIEAAKLNEQKRQFDAKLQLERTKALTDAALKATDIEAKNNVDVPGSLI